MLSLISRCSWCRCCDAPCCCAAASLCMLLPPPCSLLLQLVQILLVSLASAIDGVTSYFVCVVQCLLILYVFVGSFHPTSSVEDPVFIPILYPINLLLETNVVVTHRGTDKAEQMSSLCVSLKLAFCPSITGNWKRMVCCRQQQLAT